MLDRIVEFPGRLKLTDVETGDEQIVDVERMEGTVTEAGAPLNKNTLLSDSVATELGLSASATPSDALHALYTMFDSLVDADDTDF